MRSVHSEIKKRDNTEKNLFLTMSLNFLITIVEVTGGFLSGSLSLLSDALHNFSDAIALIITYIAMQLSKKPGTLKYTFGLKRAEILAAVINASSLIIISFFLIKEAIERFTTPEEITGSLMLTVAAVGLAANIGGTLLLKKGSKENMNLRAAYFHLFSDAVSSLAVILGAACIMLFRITWIDPLLTVVISLYILFETYKIVKDAVDVIMMSSPDGIDLEEVRKAIEKIPPVKNIHHVHVWKLNDRDTHFEAHVEVENIPVSETSEIHHHISTLLKTTFDITHVTLQFECDTCHKKTMI